MTALARSLPPFDEKGNLPPGVYDVCLADIERRLTWTPARKRLFRGLQRAAANLAAAGVRCIWIGGSFASARDEPADIDGCWEDGPWVDKDKLDPVFLEPDAARLATRQEYGLDFHVAGAWLFDVHRPVEAFLQRDKEGSRRGILRVRLGEPR